MNESPLVVTREDIAAFERNCPALAGIGEIMVRRGLWVLAGEEHREIA